MSNMFHTSAVTSTAAAQVMTFEQMLLKYRTFLFQTKQFGRYLKQIPVLYKIQIILRNSKKLKTEKKVPISLKCNNIMFFREKSK